MNGPWKWALGLLLALAFALRVAYCSVELSAARFGDESFGLRNVAAVLSHDRLWPINAFYPTLAWLPQGLLLWGLDGLAKWSGWSALAVQVGGRFTPLAYLLCRLVQVLYGTASIAALFALGRRWFGRETGWLAAAFLAAAPWHLRQSAIFKPDILLLLLQVLAFDWALRAVGSPDRRSYARAGMGIGLAAAAKYNGVAIAVPLLVGSLLGGRRVPWRTAGLVLLAGVASAASFLALDPYALVTPELVQRDFGRTLQFYHLQAHLQGQPSRWGLGWHAAKSLLHPSFHGPLVGTLALLGLLAMLWRLVRSRGSLVTEAMLLSFVIGYVAIYALSTSYQSPHNWIPLLPFSALAAADLTVRAARSLGGLLPRWWRPALTVPALLAAALCCAVPVVAETYQTVLPSTWERADGLLRRRFGAHLENRLILVEGLRRPRLTRWRRDGARPVLIRAEAISRWGLDPLRTDGEVRPASVPPRQTVAGEDVLEVLPALLRTTGPPLILRLHPWREVGDPRPLPLLSPRAFAPPPVAGGDLVSFEVILQLGKGASPVSLRWRGAEAPLLWSRTITRGGRFVSPRLPASTLAGPIELAGRPDARIVRVLAHDWSRPPGTH